MYIRIEDQDHPYSLPRPFIPFEAGCHWEIRQGLIWPKIHCQSELYCRRFNPGCYNLYVLYAAFYHFSLAAAGLGSGFCAEVQGSISSRGSSELLRQPAHITPWDSGLRLVDRDTAHPSLLRTHAALPTSGTFHGHLWARQVFPDHGVPWTSSENLHKKPLFCFAEVTGLPIRTGLHFYCCSKRNIVVCRTRNHPLTSLLVIVSNPAISLDRCNECHIAQNNHTKSLSKYHLFFQVCTKAATCTGSSLYPWRPGIFSVPSIDLSTVLETAAADRALIGQ